MVVVVPKNIVVFKKGKINKAREDKECVDCTREYSWNEDSSPRKQYEQLNKSAFVKFFYHPINIFGSVVTTYTSSYTIR